jgi:hypothetical protein
MDRYMDGWTDGWTDGCMEGWMHGWIHGWMHEGWMYVWVHNKMVDWMKFGPRFFNGNRLFRLRVHTTSGLSQLTFSDHRLRLSTTCRVAHPHTSTHIHTHLPTRPSHSLTPSETHACQADQVFLPSQKAVRCHHQCPVGLPPH